MTSRIPVKGIHSTVNSAMSAASECKLSNSSGSCAAENVGAVW
jgi:hypothetical protein